nr:AMP-binding protein [Rhodococcus sp. (in: high G+C Gram-positive bacteria)]
MTLWNALVEPADPDAWLETWENGTFERRTWMETIRTAEGIAAELIRRGVQPGDRIGSVLDNSYLSAAFVLGTWWSGGVLLSFPTPSRGTSPEAYVHQLTTLATSAEASLLVVSDEFALPLAEVVDATPGNHTSVVGFGDLDTEGTCTPRFADSDDVVFVQYSSGSTSAPKGCMLTPRAIEAQLDLIGDRIGPDELGEVQYSWLPLSHDMGLFGGFLWPWVTGMSLTMSTPTRFLRAPYTWLEECADRGATYTVGPNFGLSIALRAVRRRGLTARLALRHWIVGSDVVEHRLLAEALELLGPMGLPDTVFRPAYGMAEATLAVAMSHPGTTPSSIEVSLDGLYDGEVRAPSGDEISTRIIGCGPPMAGTSVTVDGDGPIGEILVTSPSLAIGYLGNPERTARAFPEPGVLRTGDLGFVHDGELYVVGREDDMVTVGGRNIYTSLVEKSLGEDPRLRSGSCAVVDVRRDDGSSLVIIAEPASTDIDFDATARELRQRASRESGLSISECIFVPRGSLPKSPSGKIQRFKCRSVASGDDSSTITRVKVG